jgi:hypothetical protein
VLLAEKLARIAPGDLSKVLFTTGGSDAIEVAVKVARAATGRFNLILTAIAYLQPVTRAELSRLLGKEVSRDDPRAAAGR